MRHSIGSEDNLMHGEGERQKPPGILARRFLHIFFVIVKI